MGEFFGTDGIRGVANQHPMTPEFAVRAGRAIAAFFKNDVNAGKSNPAIIIGRDTRISGDMLMSGIVSGVCSMGIDAWLTGVLPTPAIAFMTSHEKSCAGIVISASHNPYYDNGIKVFNSDGFKLSSEQETKIEKLIMDGNLSTFSESVQETGQISHIDAAYSHYKAFLLRSVSKSISLKGLKIVIDCANGATYKIAPDILKHLGAEVTPLFISPDGKNINDRCGSEHPETLVQKVKAIKADVGLAFDGDGDRLIVVDEQGRLLTGDQIIAVCARSMKRKGILSANTVVTTVMSNMGFNAAMKALEIAHATSAVGDRNVMEKMIQTGADLGGEDSGHIIFLNHHTTGDGLLSALQLLQIMPDESKPLSKLRQVMTPYPQCLMNVEVSRRLEIDSIPALKGVIRSVEKSLKQEGRVLVRYSGTQALCRVMVEGPSPEKTEAYCRQIADVVSKALG